MSVQDVLNPDNWLSSSGGPRYLQLQRRIELAIAENALPPGTPLPPEFATLSQPVSFAPDLTCFLPTRIVSNAAGQLLALPVPTNTSGDFAALTGTDGYLELAREQKDFPAGTTVPLHRWQHR